MQPQITLEEFIRRFKAHTAGTIALGTVSQRKLLSGRYDSVEAVGQITLDLDHTSTQLLTLLYRAVVPERTAAPAAAPTTKK